MTVIWDVVPDMSHLGDKPLTLHCPELFSGHALNLFAVIPFHLSKSLIDIFNRSLDEIIIIDNYAGKELLDVLKKIDRKITIVSKNIDEKLVKKYQKQYHNVTFVNNDSFHDRFIILDKYVLFMCGASFKDLGKKCFCINEMKDKIGLKDILKEIGLM